MLLAGRVPDNNLLLAGRGLDNNLLLAGMVPDNNLLLAGRVPDNNLLLAGMVPDNNFILSKNLFCRGYSKIKQLNVEHNNAQSFAPFVKYVVTMLFLS